MPAKRFEFPDKDKDAVLDYKWDWASRVNGTGPEDWLDTVAGESIATGTVSINPTGTLTINSQNLADSSTSVVAWLAGGDLHQTYELLCEIITDAGRVNQRTAKLTVVEL